MKIKYLFFLTVLVLVFANTHAGLFDPPLVNTSFEERILEPGAWSDEVMNWFDYWWSWEQHGTGMDGGGLDYIPWAPDGFNWGGIGSGGGYIYQQVGTYSGPDEYELSFTLGIRDDTPAGSVRAAVWVGGIPEAAVDWTGLVDVGASMVDYTLWPSSLYGIEYGTIDVATTLSIGESYINGAPIWLQIGNLALNGQMFVDDVKLISTSWAKDPVPQPDGPVVPVTQVLSWTPPSVFTPLGYNVYLTSDPNLPETSKVVDGDNVTYYEPEPDLKYDTEYFWRVDPIDPNDGIPSPVRGMLWTFRTGPQEPTIVTEPQNITVPSGTTAEIAVAEVHGIDYQWYLVAEPEDQEVGDNSPTLSISNVQQGDEGYYYCVVSNSHGSVTSSQVRLMVQRLVGHWKLEGDLTNEVPGGGDGTASDPNFNVGIDGSGLEFFGDGQTVVIADSTDYYNFYPQGMTVNVWVKTNTLDWDGVIAKQQRYDTRSGWTIDVYDGWSHFSVRGQTWDVWATDDDWNMFDGDWHMVTCIIDPVTLTSRVYVDGKLRTESFAYRTPATAPEPLVFGAETADGEIPYTGMLDEVSIWNYPLESLDVARLHGLYKPDVEICIGLPELDFNGNCIVDIDDFAQIASGWLDCNIVPESACFD
jgi:hypothetical protein